jgi:hypothetical protein
VDRQCSSQFPAPVRRAHPTGFFGAISTVLAEQRLGIKQVDEGIWLVSIIDYDLGYIDLEQRTLQPLDNPVWAQVVTYVLSTFCYSYLRAGHKSGCGGSQPP